MQCFFDILQDPTDKLHQISTKELIKTVRHAKARIVLLVDLREMYFRFRVGGWGKGKKRKALIITR